jgi:selenide,water dikinase
LGVGIYSAALKKGKLDAEGYKAMIASTTQLNTPGTRLGRLEDVHALTDVTGFGLLGHLLEICKASGAAARVDWNRLPLLPGVVEFAREGIVTGASGRNWTGYGDRVTIGKGLGDPEQMLLTDPQTSGGLLAACSPESVDAVLDIFRADGFGQAAVIGEISAGSPHVTIA